MRTLDSALQAALNSQTRRPCVQLAAEDRVNHLTAFQSQALVDHWSDLCVANDGSIIRVSITDSPFDFTSTFQWTRITDPSNAAQWSTLNTFAGSANLMFEQAMCAVSNNQGTLRAFAQRGTGGNDLWCWTSTNNGASWSGPVSVLAPPGGALIKGLGSAGNQDVFFIYDVLGGEALGASFYSAGSWSALYSWSLPTFLAGAGLDAYWTGSVYNLVYSDGTSLYGATYTPATNSWAGPPAVPTLAQGTTQAIGRFAPRLSLVNGLYHVCCAEVDTGSISGSVYSYCRVRASADFQHWSDGWLLPEVATAFGGQFFSLSAPAAGSSGARVYFTSMTTVLSTPVYNQANSSQYLDLSNSILSYQRVERLHQPATLEVVLDNRAGQLNGLVNLANGGTSQPLGPEATLRLSEGYLVGTPPTTPDYVASGTYHIQQIVFERAPARNQLRLLATDLTALLDRPSRFQHSYAGQTMQWLLTEICVRAGLFTVTITGGSQLTQIVPPFVLLAGQTYRQALDTLCATYGLSYLLDEMETLHIRELSASDASVWSYQPEIERMSLGTDFRRANHIIASGKPPAGGFPYLLTSAEIYDTQAHAATRVERVIHHVDQKLTTSAQCQSAANLLLAAQQRQQSEHTIVVPLHPGLQLLDVITLSDASAPIGSGISGQARIRGHTALYDAQQAEYSSQFSLEGK